MVGQGVVDRSLRRELSRGNGISWASEGDSLLSESYSGLVDIFGARLSSAGKVDLVNMMVRNSGFSVGQVNDFSLPVTITGVDDFGVASSACIYAGDGVKRSDVYHEGVHFLANHGPISKRIIRKDVPLANVLGEFIEFQDDPGKFDGNYSEDTVRALQANPFGYDFNEHEDAEVAEAVICAANAHLVAREKGERAGLEYIAKLSGELDG